MRQIKPKYAIIVFFIILNFFSNLFAKEKGIIIVNNNVPIDSTTQIELQKIYVGKMQAWHNKLKIQPCILNSKTDLSKNFFKKVMDMSYREYNRLWMRNIFSGFSAAPPSFNSPEDVIQYVSQNDGGIGFIPASMSESELLTNCKIIKLDSTSDF